ncbi:MAG: hypothetical protein EBR82_67365 [Caulobacteraceae bacterium]|nr:hypothetical protein [Caulobacteraceae bacterium]
MNGKRKLTEIDLAVERVNNWLAKRPEEVFAQALNNLKAKWLLERSEVAQQIGRKKGFNGKNRIRKG